MAFLNTTFRVSALALAGALLFAAPAAAQASSNDPDRVIARAGEVEVTQADLDVALADPSLALPNVDEAQRRETVIAYLVDLKLGARAAVEAGIAETPEFARRLAYFRDKLLLDDYLEARVAEQVTEEAARALYDQTMAGVEPQDEVRARHILVPDEEEAQAIVARLAAGEEFEEVAREASQDPGSAAGGGDLGYFTKERMVAPFAEAAFAMEAGDVSDPVQTQFGWHVIKVEDRRKQQPPSFEAMREQIDNFLARRAQQELVLALREGVEIERLDAPAAPEGEAAPETAPR
ncbi:MAG: peptidylprolyl isomerase [Salinarimonadaceae bacterium]|nr:MAG: peptidylprolyl isomerase [Salinarimonadaceae bacterium]